MNNLYRELAPINERAWSQIEEGAATHPEEISCGAPRGRR
jgi:uncharacterized linocin/CFP29 family protein